MSVLAILIQQKQLSKFENLFDYKFTNPSTNLTDEYFEKTASEDPTNCCRLLRYPESK